MWFFEDDTIITREDVVDVKDLGELNFNNTNMFFYFYFEGAVDENILQIIPYDEEKFKPYLELTRTYANQRDGNKGKPDFGKMRHCKREDFEKFNHGEEFDRLNKNDPDKKSTICFDNPEDFRLENQKKDDDHQWFGLLV